jgi:N-succinyldiaminopimelate aminotransferase
VQSLDEVLGSDPAPNHYNDAALLKQYQESGADTDALLYLSLGETWTQTAPGLREALAQNLPSYTHGYLLSPYGLPALRTAIQRYI